LQRLRLPIRAGADTGGRAGGRTRAGAAPPPRSRSLAGFANFDDVFLMNLPQGAYRLAHARAMLESANVKAFHLIRAVPNECGASGCSLSHAVALQLYKGHGWRPVCRRARARVGAA